MLNLNVTTVKAHIIQIGNSSGIILPKAILQTFGLQPKTSVSIVELNGTIVIKPEPRATWSVLFKAYAQEGEEKLVPDFLEDETTNTEWVW